MKLTRGKLVETLRRKNDGWTTYQARKIAGIGIRRVNQVYAQYRRTGKIPKIGLSIGRPKRSITDEEIRMVVRAFKKYKVSASTLMRLIKQDCGVHINHHRVHAILLKLGYAKRKGKKDIRKKVWIRYERRHSLTAVHIDWYFDAKTRLWVFAVIDDASRKLLALLEVESPTVDASIRGMQLALTHGRIRQCISDHGSQFVSNIGGDSKFKAFLDEHKIQQILCKIKHPQSNGKVEKFFDLYKNKRHLFSTKGAFERWYNEIRPHRSLHFEVLETPQQAFLRKMQAEV
jgi:putative transposase